MERILELNAADVDWYFRACKIFAQTFRAHFCFDPIADALGEMISLLDEEKGQIVYSLETFVGVWEIARKPDTSWTLRQKAHFVWKDIGVYKSPEEATWAVGSGRTHVTDWDVHQHRREDFNLSRWSQKSA